MIFDPVYLIFIMLPVGLLTLWTQMKVKGAFNKYSRVRPSSGMTGAQAAYQMLRSAGLSDRVGIQRVSGFLSDHYDPRSKVLRLSPEVHDGCSLAAVGVACHEVGHALQDAKNYTPLVLRNAIVPTAGIGSNIGVWMMIGGLVLSGMLGKLGMLIALVGLILFAMVAVFQIVNLPVEFNASARAKAQLPQLGIINGPREAEGVAKVLDAAAMTYVAATIGAILNVLYWAYLIFNRRN